MTLKRRLERLEFHCVPYSQMDHGQTLLQDISDWITHDPRAAELLRKEFNYCVSMGYSTTDDNFPANLDDPVLGELYQEAMAVFEEYLRGRSVSI